jgi:hypothetical protein
MPIVPNLDNASPSPRIVIRIYYWFSGCTTADFEIRQKQLYTERKCPRILTLTKYTMLYLGALPSLWIWVLDR